MTADPPCPRRDKWFRGCRFEPRYDLGAPIYGKVKLQDEDLETFLRGSRPKTYVLDVCVTCGKVVDRGGVR